jgi:hypothetical protein
MEIPVNIDKSLGKLQKVDLREVWEHEALSFTKWLSREENLEQLGKEIGIPIKLIKTEAEVGGFNVDILAEAEEEGSGPKRRKIIIENQLETTNHDHLGKLITYASGTDASIIIWIFKEIRNEHRSAIQWLNEHTDENIEFFAVKMELWQIGNSLPAPKFQVVSNPNIWTKIAKTSTEQNELTPTKLYQFQFWNSLKEFVQAHDPGSNFTKIYPQNWYNFSVGSASCHLSLTINNKTKELGCELYIPDDKELFDFLSSRRSEIEKEVGVALDWQRLPEETKASRIKISKRFDVVGDQDFSKYTDAFKWLESNLAVFRRAFTKHLSQYKYASSGPVQA